MDPPQLAPDIHFGVPVGPIGSSLVGTQAQYYLVCKVSFIPVGLSHRILVDIVGGVAEIVGEVRAEKLVNLLCCTELNSI